MSIHLNNFRGCDNFMSKDHWDQSFSEEDYVYGETENKFIHKMSSIIPENSKIGCFAEGEGRNAVYLAKLGHDVTAYDQSVVGLRKTKDLAQQNNVSVRIVEKDLIKEKVKTSQYDAAIMVFGHVQKQHQQFFIENMIGAVKSGGYIIFEIYSVDQLMYQTGGPRTIESLYDPLDILKWIKSYKCVHFYYGEEERHEGKRHNGRCHVIQVVIKKESKEL